MRYFCLFLFLLNLVCAENLFLDTRNDVLSNENQQKVDRIWDNQSTVNVRTAKIDFGVLEKQIDIDFNVFPGVSFKSLRTEIYNYNANEYTWKGLIVEGEGSATIVVSGNQATGTLVQNDNIYRISPLDNDTHTITQVNLAMFPQEHPPLFESGAIENNNMDIFDEQPSRDDNRAATIDILVAYTPSAASASGNIENLVRLAMEESNTSYRNSGIDIQLRLVHTYLANYRESGNFSTDLSRFRNKNDGYMDEVHTKRDQYRADICVIIVNNNQYCGLASKIYASETSAFAAVHYDCATGYYSFAHEIGHLQGARHNPEMDPSTNPFSYGHGFQDPKKNWRTIMAYNCNGGCTRIPYWSNPSQKKGGTNMGTTSSHNNARVLQQTANTMANFR